MVNNHFVNLKNLCILHDIVVLCSLYIDNWCYNTFGDYILLVVIPLMHEIPCMLIIFCANVVI